eukprot:CAMPEP_0114536774 /NCGR_PEP_ID=MMETSP0109-20121206/29198_1 /TAXON_ID=29199 /ORGANISM="Chlorarachnion reptans, Strain CCCM449" /LENGTH=177 /DNA_ID=CAMNT_0001720567 /DNA_START=513 /DNA_END=1047 /DNA_ORIENTATION=-
MTAVADWAPTLAVNPSRKPSKKESISMATTRDQGTRGFVFIIVDRISMSTATGDALSFSDPYRGRLNSSSDEFLERALIWLTSESTLETPRSRELKKENVYGQSDLRHHRRPQGLPQRASPQRPEGTQLPQRLCARNRRIELRRAYSVLEIDGCVDYRRKELCGDRAQEHPSGKVLH